MTGTSAILFIHVDEDETIDNANARLFKLLENIPKIPDIPVMILTTSDLKTWPGSLDHIAYDILKTSVDVFKITTITSAIEAVKRLPKMSKPFDLDSIEGLNVKPIKDYVEDFLVQDHE